MQMLLQADPSVLFLHRVVQVFWAITRGGLSILPHAKGAKPVLFPTLLLLTWLKHKQVSGGSVAQPEAQAGSGQAGAGQEGADAVGMQ